MNKKPFLCFWLGVDGGDRESYSVYYSALVYADNKEEALDKFINSEHGFEEKDPKYYGAIDLIEKNQIIE